MATKTDSSLNLYAQTCREKEVVKVSGRGSNVGFILDDRVPFQEVEDRLRFHLHNSHGWFAGAEVTVNVGRRVLDAQDLSRLKGILEDEYRLRVSSFHGEDDASKASIDEGLMATVAQMHLDQVPTCFDEAPNPQRNPLFVKSNCRSGTIIDHSDDVIVLGDVNPGAQIIASGDIIVIGTLRGVAHAGANASDGESAVIIALSLKPSQLRIGMHLSVAPPEKPKASRASKPEIAYVSGKSIVVAPFKGRFQSMQERNRS